MIKYIGAMLIFASTYYWGFRSSLIPYKRYKNLMKINSGFLAMKNEIRYSGDYIDEVLLKTGKVIDFKKIFLTAAQMDKMLPIRKRWEEAVILDSPSLYFNNDDIEILNMFSQELGMTDREGQIKNIEHTVELIKHNINSAKEEYDNMSKLKKGLGISAGLFAIILLL